mmetsp:Transcript_15777/g.34244  ORF Transcript_15777/g.34244 Transcript_15777/m.34244 type:complete len:91 (-) Transcript_15777:307-579(-)
MAKSRGPSAPVRDLKHSQRFRQEQGQHHAKLGRTENRETHVRAVARKQPFPTKMVVVTLVVFAAVSSALYMYLTYVVEEDDDLPIDAEEV